MSVNAISQAKVNQPGLQGLKPQSQGNVAFANVFVQARANGQIDQARALNVNTVSANNVQATNASSFAPTPANNGLNGNNGKDFSAIFANTQNSLQDLQISTYNVTANQNPSEVLNKIGVELNSQVYLNSGLTSPVNATKLNPIEALDSLAVEEKATPNAWGVDDYYLMQALQSSGKSASSDLVENDSQVINLQHLSLDFSSLLPAGTRDFLKNVKADPNGVDQVVNTMLFGVENGPQGKNAAQFFGKESMSKAELSANVQELLDKARINTQHVTAQDINFVLKDDDAVFGQNLASTYGQSLNARAMEHNLESVYQNDMALMQLVSRSNNQSANIF